MARIEKTVFISYRRTNLPWALAISQALTQHGFDVFLDYTGIASGDFESSILENIHSRAHFLVLLTPSALERCGEPGDWFRREIEAALDSGRNVVPLMFDGFSFATPTISSQLTCKLAILKQYNAINVLPEYFDAAMAKLREKFLNVPLDAVLHPASLAAQKAATEQTGAAARAPRVAEEELTAQQWFERGVGATKHDEKLRFFNQAIRLNPRFAEALALRAAGHLKRENLEAALADFSEAIRYKPEFALALCGRGATRGFLGDQKGAIEDYSEAIRLRPDLLHDHALYERGTLLQATGNLAGALEDYSEALRLNPDNVKALCNRGVIRYQNGDLEGALRDFERAIRLRPGVAGIFNNRGKARKAKGDLEGALADFNESIRLQPDYADAFVSRGSTRYKKGDLEGALADFDEVLRLQPNDALTNRNREVVRKAIADRSKS